MKITKKLISIILSIIMLFSLTLICVSANDTNNKPTHSSSAEKIVEAINVIAKNETDVDMNEATTNNIQNDSDVSNKKEQKVNLSLTKIPDTKEISFNLIISENENLKVILNKDNNYTQTIKVKPGTYKISNLTADKEDTVVSIKKSEVIINEETKDLSLDISLSTIVKPRTFKELFFDNLFLLILLAISIAALYINRARRHEKVFRSFDNLSDTIKKMRKK